MEDADGKVGSAGKDYVMAEVWKRGEPLEQGSDFYDDRQCDVCEEHFGHGDKGIPMTCADASQSVTLRAFVHEGCAAKVESEGSTVVSYAGRRHTMERATVYQMTCGSCGKTWYENWGSMDDMCGTDPEDGMDACCQHCKVDLPMYLPPPE